MKPIDDWTLGEIETYLMTTWHLLKDVSPLERVRFFMLIRIHMLQESQTIETCKRIIKAYQGTGVERYGS